MTTDAHSGGRGGFPWRAIGWGGAALVLTIPLVAMRFTDEVKWTVGDFIFAILLIGAVGALFELTVRASRNHAWRAGVGLALAASFLTIWVNGAVGMIGDEDNSYNLFFLGVIAIALAGTVAARVRPGGMALAMLAAALAQVTAAAFGLATDPRGAVFSAAFAGLWLLSSALLAKAARDEGRAGAGAA